MPSRLNIFTLCPRRILLSTLLLPAIFLSACAALRPSATPADAQVVLAKAAEYRSGTKSLGATKESRTPLKSGQWAAALIRSKGDPNDVTLQIAKVVDVSGSAVTLETEIYAATDGGNRTVTQQRIRNYPITTKVVLNEVDAATTLNGMAIESFKIIDTNDVVQEVPQFGIPLGKVGTNFFRANFATGEVRSEPCESSELKASKCLLVPYSYNVLFVSDSGITYAHSDVPVLGFIKSDGQDTETTVIGYGSSGAKIIIR